MGLSFIFRDLQNRLRSGVLVHQSTVDSIRRSYKFYTQSTLHGWLLLRPLSNNEETEIEGDTHGDTLHDVVQPSS